MKKSYQIAKDIMVTIGILCVCFFICFAIHNAFERSALIPSVLVLGVFLISVITHGYVYGTVAAIIIVLANNFAFTFPFYSFSYILPENIISTMVLFVITLVTCNITAKLKKQESINMESEQERMRANLLRSVSHDLRTPLTTIYSSSSVLLDNYDEFSDKQRMQILKGISEDSLWLSRMVENLLSITKLDSANVKVIKTNTALDELIDSALIKYSKRYPYQKVTVDIPDEFLFIPMDSILIEQVIINILENAVQHAKGMTKLSLKVFSISDKVIFEIKDNGCGIPEERMKHIFTGYYSQDANASDSRKHNAGIGLSVCASIIKAHGGDIKAENLKSGGCVFRFTLNMEDNEYDKQ